jgi:hypothetical protein
MDRLSTRIYNESTSWCRGERGNTNIIAAVVIALLFVVLLFGRKLGLPSDLRSLLSSQPTIKVKADAWKALTPPESGFSVEMPGAPESSTRSGMIDGRPVSMRLYQVQNEGKYQFNVSVVDVREMMQNQNLDPEAVLGTYVQGLVRTAKGKLVSEKLVRLDIFSGREILVESDGAISRVRIYLKDAYLYAVEARSTRKFITSADADRFFASFKFAADAPSGAPVAPGWTEFAPVGGRFSVQMPGLPRSEQQYFHTKGGDMVLYLFILDRGGASERFSAQYTDYPEQFLKESQSADAVLKKASTVDAFNIGGRVVSEKALSLGRHLGRELQVENAELSMRIRLYLVDQRLYKVVAAWPKSRVFSVEDELFLNSFRLAN